MPARSSLIVIPVGACCPGVEVKTDVSPWEREVHGRSVSEITTVLLEHWCFRPELVAAVRDHSSRRLELVPPYAICPVSACVAPRGGGWFGYCVTCGLRCLLSAYFSKTRLSYK